MVDLLAKISDLTGGLLINSPNIEVLEYEKAFFMFSGSWYYYPGNC